VEPPRGHAALVLELLRPARLLDRPVADGLERRREPVDRTKAIPYARLDRLWRRDDIAVREKALWRLLYETAARAQEALSLNVEDVDLNNKRARVRSKGGDTEGCTCRRARRGFCRG
jgi:integrase